MIQFQVWYFFFMLEQHLESGVVPTFFFISDFAAAWGLAREESRLLSPKSRLIFLPWFLDNLGVAGKLTGLLPDQLMLRFRVFLCFAVLEYGKASRLTRERAIRIMKVSVKK